MKSRLALLIVVFCGAGLACSSRHAMSEPAGEHLSVETQKQKTVAGQSSITKDEAIAKARAIAASEGFDLTSVEIKAYDRSYMWEIYFLPKGSLDSKKNDGTEYGGGYVIRLTPRGDRIEALQEQ